MLWQNMEKNKILWFTSINNNLNWAQRIEENWKTSLIYSAFNENECIKCTEMKNMRLQEFLRFNISVIANLRAHEMYMLCCDITLFSVWFFKTCNNPRYILFISLKSERDPRPAKRQIAVIRRMQRFTVCHHSTGVTMFKYFDLLPFHRMV